MYAGILDVHHHGSQGFQDSFIFDWVSKHKNNEIDTEDGALTPDDGVDASQP